MYMKLMTMLCRIYVEREERSVKLYVTNIQPTDQGRYRCLRMHGGVKREEKAVRLSIFSECTLLASLFDADKDCDGDRINAVFRTRQEL